MANRGYDVVVDVDTEGDLGHTDLQEDLEFHTSSARIAATITPKHTTNTIHSLRHELQRRTESPTRPDLLPHASGRTGWSAILL